ncbi:MAG: serine protease [Candidatus Marinimicrobia bacterium]|nr:serine protease [Candidatus Neomarinimicrobiota bacterium]
MKRTTIKILMTLTLTWNVLSAGVDVLNPYLFCLTPDTPPLTEKQLHLGHTGIPVIDSLITRNPGLVIRPWLPASEPHEHSGDIYLNRIYQITGFSENKSTVKNIMEDLARDPKILYTEKEPEIKVRNAGQFQKEQSSYIPNDPLYSQQWWIRQIEAQEAWGLWDVAGGATPGSREVRVAIVDTGVEWTHPDLIHNIWQNVGEDANGNGKTIVYLEGRWQMDPGDLNGVDDDDNGYKDDLIGWDPSGSTYLNGDNDPMAVLDGPAPVSARMHGTHCAGIAGASTDNGTGIAGTAFNISIVPVKTMTDNNEGGFLTYGYQGIQYAYKSGADIISLSWGDTTYSYSARSVVQEAKKEGSILIAAAGNGTNEGTEKYGKFYPASYPEVISVTALGPNDRWGKWANYHEDVDIAAPGESILSTVFSTSGTGDLQGYQSWWGTSMATPIVAGSVALLKSYMPGQTVQWYTDQILNNTDDIYTINDDPEYAGRLGRGRVNPYKAIAQALKPQLVIQDQKMYILSDDGDGILNPGEEVRLQLTLLNEPGWQDGQNIKAVLHSTTPGIIITDSVATFSDLSSGESGTHSEKLQFHIVPEASTGESVLECRIYSENLNGDSFEDRLPIPVQVSLFQKGFPVPLSEMIVSSVLVWDINHDGQKEIVAGTFAGNIMAWTSTGDTLPGFPISAGGLIPVEIAAGDLDQDDTLELAAVTTTGKIILFNGWGETFFSYAAGNSIVAAPSIGQLDGGEDLEVVVGTKGEQILALKKNGELVQGFPLNTGDIIQNAVSVSDSLHESPVLAYSTGGGDLYLTDEKGTPLTGWPVHFSEQQATTPVLIHYEGELIIAAGLSDGKLVLLQEDGSVRATVSGLSKVIAEPTVVRTPSGPALAYPYDVRKVSVVDLQGNILPGWPVVFEQILSRIAAGDIDNNGTDEIVAVSANGEVAVWNIKGEMFPGYPILTQENINSGPVLSDLDGDGDAEICVAGDKHLMVWDVKSASADDIYLTMGGLRGGGPGRTHRYDYTFTGMNEHLIPGEFGITALYPNPFNPQTTISWNQPREGKTHLVVYDLTGREVYRQTLYGFAGQNTYLLTANGWSSGLYFLRLSSGDRSVVKRLVFLK